LILAQGERWRRVLVMQVQGVLALLATG